MRSLKPWILSLILVLAASLLPVLAQQEFPLPQVADGPQIRTTFVLFNTNGVTVQVTIEITGDNGAPLPMDLADLGVDSEFNLSLAPGETMILESNGTGSGAPGAALVSASAPIGVSAIFSLFDGQGNFLTETGIGSSPPETQFVLPVDTTGPFNTGLALFNRGTVTANLELVFCDLDGNQIATTDLQLVAGGHLARFVEGEFFVQLVDVKGTLKVTSDQPISALTLRQNIARLNVTTLPVVPSDSTQTTFVLPHVADGPFPGGRIKMTFLVFSLSGQDATATLNLTDDDGDPFEATIGGVTGSSFQINLGAGESAFLETDGTGGGSAALTAGAAVITSDQPIGVSGIFTLVDGAGNFLTETGVGDSAPLALASIALDNRGDFDTGIAMFNPGNTPVTVNVRLFDAGGQSAASEDGASPQATVIPIVLDPLEHFARFIPREISEGIEIDVGSASFEVEGGNAVFMTLRQKGTPLSFTGFPVGMGAFLGVPAPQNGFLLDQQLSDLVITQDRVIDMVLPGGFRLFGDLDLPDGFFGAQVTARRSDGTTFFGLTDFLGGTYQVIVPAGTYTVSICIFGGPNFATQLLHRDPTSIPVTQDTEHDIVIPAPALRTVSGMIMGMEKLPPSDTMLLSVATVEGDRGSTVPLPESGAYSVIVPPGNYIVGVLVFKDDVGSNLGVGNIGQVVVGGSDIAGANFQIPDIVTVSGDVTNSDASPLMPTFVFGADQTIPLPTEFCVVPVRSSNETVNSPYLMHIVANRLYQLFATQTVLEGSGNQFDGTVTVPFDPPRQFQTSTNRIGEDFVFPMLPELVTVMGMVTNSSGTPVQNTFVIAFTSNLSGTPGASFNRSARTDDNGNYRLDLPMGIDYEMFYFPPLPTGGTASQ